MMAASAEAIAIVGVAAELPSGTYSTNNLDHRSFFKFLLDKGESYEKIPSDRLNIDALRGSAQGQVLPSHGSFLKNLQAFDHLEFGVTAKDARAMAVSTRKLLELSFLSLLDSGINYRARNVGCYMAGISHDIYSLSGQNEAEARGAFSCMPAMIANRVSYHLDLRGPSVPVDTACSSSHMATHLAVQALRGGECEAAVVGGSQINLRFIEWLNYTQGGVLSADGKCKPFDASADGFSRGEGAVVMVLKPLQAAVRDGDHIYASLLGTGVNSSGSLAPVNAPVASAQEDAMRRAFLQAGRKPEEVDFIELHATGTARGDPTEANWVGAAFHRKDELLLGSVKGNVGHLEITAFLASLSKVCSMFEAGVIPPNANINTLNPAIHWDEYKLRVPQNAIPLPCRSPEGRSLIAMTSSGIGGSNGHCVIEGPPRRVSRATSFWRGSFAASLSLLIAAGLSPRSAAAVVDTTREIVEKNGPPSGLALTLGRRARSMTWRSFAVASSSGGIPRFSEPILVPKTRQPLVFVFSGQGPQHFHMGRELFRASRVFHDAVVDMDLIFERITGESLIRTYGLFGTHPALKVLSEPWPIAITLPSLTIIQLALFDTVVSLGLRPDAVVGHSAGETAVLYASGAASRETALEVSIARGQSMSLLESRSGTMAAVSCSPAEAERIIASVKSELGQGHLEIGCYNTAEAVTLSGQLSHVDCAVAKATAMGVFARRLRTRVPVHSSMMEICEAEYCKLVGDVFERSTFQTTTTSVYSAATGGLLREPMNAAYFWKNTRGPVLFTHAIGAATAALGSCTFVELGPHPVLSSYLSTLGDSSSTVTCPLRRPNQKEGETDVEVATFLASLGQLVVNGHDSVDHTLLAEIDTRPTHHVPAYPLAPKHVPYSLPSQEAAKFLDARHGPLNHPYLRVNSATHPDLAQHVINGEPIMPAAGYLEMALEYGARHIWDVSFVSMIGLSAESPVAVHVRLDNNYWSVTTPNVKDGALKNDRLHAEGYLAREISPAIRVHETIDLDAVRCRCKAVNLSGFYDGLSYFAQYGPQYQRVQALWRGKHGEKEETLVKVKGFTKDLERSHDYVFHPAVFDAAIHAMVHPMITGNRDRGLYYLPSSLKEMIVHDALLTHPLPETLYTYTTLEVWTPGFLAYNCCIVNEAGIRLCTFEHFEIAQHGQFLTPVPAKSYDLVYVDPTIALETRAAASDSSASDSGYESGDQQTDLRNEKRSAFVDEVISYRRGGEMDIQARIRSLVATESHILWFTAVEGPHGDCALGFTRTLRREYPAWTIRCVLFNSQSLPSDERSAVAKLSRREELEDEMVVNEHGVIMLPRIQPVVVADAHLAAFDPSRPWSLVRGQIQHTSYPLPRHGYSMVQLDSLSDGEFRIRGFIGRVHGNKARVVGITDQPIGNVVCVPTDSLIELGPDAEDIPVLPMAIAVLAIGLENIKRRDRLQGKTVLITHADTPVGIGVADVLKTLPVQVRTLMHSATAYELAKATSDGVDLVISAYDAGANADLLARKSESGRLFSWNDELSSTLSKQAWIIGVAIRTAIESGFASGSSSPMRPLLDWVRDAPSAGSLVRTNEGLFQSNKTYLLLGGIGSLGLQIASWMYENGARHIVMTSRSGRSGVEHRADLQEQRTLAYLEAIDDLSLKLVAVDTTNRPDLSALVSRVEPPVAGCMLLSGVLHDGMFALQTKDSYEVPFGPKVDAFKALSESLCITALDWLIAFTSISGLFGNAGQTNYASANTAVDGMTRQFENAFSLITPVINDSHVAVSAKGAQLSHLTSWGFSSRELCACIGDGIQRLRQGPFWLYIPDFNWQEVEKHLGPSPVLPHFAGTAATILEEASELQSLEKLVRDLLDVASSDFSSDVPLTSYGLDSLSAARLSIVLRPFLDITQMQLLADVSLEDIMVKIEHQRETSSGGLDSAVASGPPISAVRKTDFDWANSHLPGQTVVKMVEDPTNEMTPLILLHGISGNGMTFQPLEEHFTTPLWALQITPETPFDDMDALVEFYYRQIKAARPRGPYRIGAFCATSPIGYELVRTFEEHGEEVSQFALFDHFPLLYCTSTQALDIETLRSGSLTTQYLDGAVDFMIRLYEGDLTPARQRIVDGLRAAARGEEVQPSIRTFYDNFLGQAKVIVDYLLALGTEFAPKNAQHADPVQFTTRLRDAMQKRMREVRVPAKVYAAKNGVGALPGVDWRWSDFGIPKDNFFEVEGGHFDIFQQKVLAESLQAGWQDGSLTIMMRALVTSSPSTVSVQQIVVPKIGPGEVLVKIVAAAQNPTDWKHALEAKPGLVAGCDFAGRVAQLGEGVTTLNVGDRVSGFEHGSQYPDRGAFAEYTKARADLVWRIPNKLSYEDAATMNGGLWTAIQSLYHPTRLALPAPAVTSPAPWVLIYGGSTSVGLFAVQLLRRAGYRIITTCSPRNFELVKSLGADIALDYNDAAWTEEAKSVTGESIVHGLDAISTDESIKTSLSVFGPNDGMLVTLAPPRPTMRELRPNIKIYFTLLYTALGRPFTFLNSRDIPAAPEDVEHMASWMPRITELVQDGLKPNPVKLWDGGLEAIPDGYRFMQEGRISAEKIVYRITPDDT